MTSREIADFVAFQGKKSLRRQRVDWAVTAAYAAIVSFWALVCVWIYRAIR